MTSKVHPYQVPSWLEPLLPDLRTPTEIDILERPDGSYEYVALGPDGTGQMLGEDLIAAYDAVADDHDVVLSAAALHFARFRSNPSFGVGMDGIGVWGRGRYLSTETDEYRLARLVAAWERFKELDVVWRANPTFEVAYHWIDCHPAFWTRASGALDRTTRQASEALWTWVTESHMSDVTVRVPHPFSSRGGAPVRLWTMGHNPEDELVDIASHTVFVLTDAYHNNDADPPIEAEGDTYESAVLNLARRIDAVYDTEGNRRPGEPAAPDEPVGTALRWEAHRSRPATHRRPTPLPRRSYFDYVDPLTLEPRDPAARSTAGSAVPGTG